MQFWEDVKSIIEYAFFGADWTRLIFAVLSILLSLALRQFFVKVVIKFLKKVTVNSKTNIDTHFIWAIEVPARFIIVVIGIWGAVLIMDFPEKSQELINRILRSLVAFSVFRAAYRVSDILVILMEKITNKSETKLDDMLLLFIRKSLKIVILVIGTVTIVQEWYDNIGGLLAGLGLGGLAFALAARDTVANLFGSITIMVDRPFKIGDWISTGQTEGIIEEIGFRSTKVRTFAQAVVTIPNSIMSNECITNWSRMGKRRIDFRLGLKYSTTSDQLKELINHLKDMLHNHPDVHEETIIVCFERFGESSLDIYFYLFTKQIDWVSFLKAKEDINFNIMKKLEEMGLEVAYPSKSVYIEEKGDQIN